MPDPSPEEIEEFLKTIANLLNTSLSIPEYSDLFASEDKPTPGQLGMARPDEIEAALVMGLQRAEIALQEAAEENRVALQWSIVEGVSQRNEKLPEGPSREKLEIVAPITIPNVESLTNEAEKAFQQLSAARGEPDDAFEKATDNALLALDERDNGIAKQHEAVAAELERRRQAVTKLQEAFALADKEILPKAKELLKVSNAKTVKPLKSALPLCVSALNTLESNISKDPPNVFNDIVNRCDLAIQDVREKTAKVNELATTEMTKDRLLLFAKLSAKAPIVALSDLSLVEPDKLQSHNSIISTWQNSHEKLSQQKKDFGKLSDFEESLSEIENNYGLAQESTDSIKEAAKKERERRDQIAVELEKLRKEVKAPDPKPLPNTEEQVEYALSEKLYDGAMQSVTGLKITGSTQEFAEAEKSVRESISSLEKAGPIASELAKVRLEKSAEQRKKINELVGPTFKNIDSQLKGGPASVVVKAMQEALGKQAKSRTALIKGINFENDQKLADELETLVQDTEKLILALKAFETTRILEVAKNIEIKNHFEKLKSTVDNPGIGKESIEIVNIMSSDVGKIASRYDDIETTQLRYEIAIKDKKIEPNSQKILVGFPDFEKSKDDLRKGDLTSRTNVFLIEIRKIEDKIADNKEKAQSEEQRKLYLASDAYKFLVLMEKPESEDPVTKLETLVTESKVTQGSITDAYRSNWDKPDRFSVEVDVLIETYDGVVVHAHCGNDGEPQSGNGCHIKLWKYRFDAQPSFELSSTLRTKLLPPKASCLDKAQSKGLA